MHYTLTIYIDPKVQPPLPKQNMTKHPKSHQLNKTGIISADLNDRMPQKPQLPFLLG